jgi:hypothetical protein
VGSSAAPSAQALQKLLTSLKSSGGIQQLMSLLYYGVGATNGYNADGHYVRVAPIVGACTAYARTPVAGCSANFAGSSSAAAAVAARAVSEVLGPGSGSSKREQAAPLGGLLRYLTGARG